MAGEVPVNVTNLTTGIPIAAELVSMGTTTTAYAQQVKLLDGTPGGTTGIPGNTAGLFVQYSSVPQVNVSAMPAVSGTVSVLGSVSLSGTGVVSVVPGVSVTISGLPVTISGITPVTTQTSVSVSGVPVWFNVGALVSVSGTAVVSVVPGVSVTVVGLPVTISGIVPVTTAASVSVSGVPIWMNPTQGVNVSTVSGTVNVTVIGTAVASVVPGVSVTIVGLPVTISGIVPVTTAASVSVSGVPVWLNPTQSVNVGSIVSTVLVNIVAGAAGGGSVTTSAPSITASGQVVWVAGGQSTTVSPVFVSQINPPAAGGGSVVTTQAGGTSTGQLVWLATTQQMSVTISGTAVMSVVPGVSVTIVGLPVTISGIVPVTTQTSVSVSGLPVWINPGALVSLSGTGVVSVVPGVSVTIVGLPVTISGVVPVTTQTSVSVSGLPVWWQAGALIGISVSQALGTVITILGTQVVSVVPGVSVTISGLPVTISGIVPVTTAASVSVSGLPVWLNPTQTVAISGAVSAVTTQTAVTGAEIWWSPTALVGVGGLYGGYLLAAATSTAVSSSTQVLLQSVYVSTGSTLGTSGWTIGSGSALVVYGLAFGWSQAAANNQATFALLVTNSGTTLSTVTPAWAQVTFSTAAALSTVISSGFVPGTVVGINTSVATIPFPWVIPGPAVIGVAVAATSSGATVYASINAQVVNTIPMPLLLAPGATVGFSSALLTTALPSVSATGVAIWNVGISITATQAAISGQVMWLAPTQTMTVTIAGIAGVTTAASVSVTGLPVWLNPTQGIVAQISSIVPVTTQVSVSVSGLPVWMNPTQSVIAAISAGLISTTQPPSGVTGIKVWPGNPVNIPFMLQVTSTAIVQSATAYLMTVWTGSTVAAAGTSLYAVPAGQNLRLFNNLGIVTTSAVVGGTVQMVVAFGTNAASLVSGSVRTQGFAMLNQIIVTSANAVSAAVEGGQADIGAGATIAPFIIASTAAVLQNMIVQGYLF